LGQDSLIQDLEGQDQLEKDRKGTFYSALPGLHHIRYTYIAMSPMYRN
jgi:hypothetical protein